jgi:hypothetical protein
VVPEGYREGGADVIRLSSDLKSLKEQQGYIACAPLHRAAIADPPGAAPRRVHLAVQVSGWVCGAVLLGNSWGEDLGGVPFMAPAGEKECPCLSRVCTGAGCVCVASSWDRLVGRWELKGTRQHHAVSPGVVC